MLMPKFYLNIFDSHLDYSIASKLEVLRKIDRYMDIRAAFGRQEQLELQFRMDDLEPAIINAWMCLLDFN